MRRGSGDAKASTSARRSGAPSMRTVSARKAGAASSKARKTRFAKRPVMRLARPGIALGSTKARGVRRLAAAATAGTAA